MMGHVMGNIYMEQQGNFMSLDVWWWRPDKGINFGDELGPEILKRLGYTIKRAPLHAAEIVTIGSVLEWVERRAPKQCVIWGAGTIKSDSKIKKDLDIRAVRGMLSAKACNVSSVLGDPGVLVSALWDKPDTKYNIGVVPHYIDTRNFPWADIIIDVTNPVDQVIQEIGSCGVVISSSLHGLIVANSFGIQTMRMHHPRVIGGDHKWMDYSTAMNKPIHKIQEDLLKVL